MLRYFSRSVIVKVKSYDTPTKTNQMKWHRIIRPFALSVLSPLCAKSQTKVATDKDLHYFLFIYN